jgi:peptidyl-prolyl cis-trans isomerase SurA
MRQWLRISAWMCAFVTAPILVAAQQISIAAAVNDTIITTADVRDRVDIMRAFSNAPDTPAATRTLTRQALRALMNEALQNEEAKRLSIKVSDAEVDEAIARIEQARGREPGSLRAFLKETGLPEDAFTQQLRTQAAWRKVVQRRLRRNVTITDEEIGRAQQVAANQAGAPHVRIAAIAIPITEEGGIDKAAAYARTIRERLVEGESFETVARALAGQRDVRLNPSIWVPEERLEPSIANVMRALQVGQVTEPLRSLNTFQIVQLQDRRFIKPVAPETEIAVKQITVVPQPDALDLNPGTMMRTAELIREAPGSCVRDDIGNPDATSVDVQVRFLRTQMKEIAPPLLPTVSALNVGEVSAPFISEEGIQMLLLCEKIAPAIALPDKKIIRDELFAKKIELEAEKHLRNLKRDAFIDVKLDAGVVL